MWGRHLIVTGLILIALAVVIGCGGDDSSDESASALTAAGQTTASDEDQAENDTSSSEGANATEVGSSKAEFIREGNDICRISVAKIQLVGKKVFNEVHSNADAPAFKRKLVKKVLVPNLEAEVEGLKQLEPPAGDEAEVEKVIASIEEVIKRIESDPKAYGYYPYVQAEKAADAYGLDLCGQPSL